MENRAHHPHSSLDSQMGTAVITGASGGIGMAYAGKLASLGYDLIITGRNTIELNKLADELEQRYCVHVKTVSADLSRDSDLRKLSGMLSERDDITLLVNNAGFGSGRFFHEEKESEHIKMLKVHIEAPVKLIYAVLPRMVRRKRGAIINVSSLGAFAPAAGSVMYSGTKLFLKNFTESLHLEASPSGIKVQCICPGLTRTGFHKRRSSGEPINAKGWLDWMEPEEVVNMSLHALEKGKIVYIPGARNRLVAVLLKLIPYRMYYFLMFRIQRIRQESRKGQTENQYIPGRVVNF